jgi:large subunit ribosomal protein L23
MLIKPIITEKSIKEASGGRYSFVTTTSMSKPEIKQWVEKLFGVNVIKIQTSIQHGKLYRSGRRQIFKRKSDWKKAIVTTKKDQKIKLFEMPGAAQPELAQTGSEKPVKASK